MKKFTFLLFACLLAANASAADKYVTVAEGDVSTAGSFENVMATLGDGDVLKFNITGTDQITTYAVAGTTASTGAVIVIEGINEATGNKISAVSDGLAHQFYKGLSSTSYEKMQITFRNLNIKNYILSGNGAAIGVGNSGLGASYLVGNGAKLTFENCEISGCTSTIATATSGGGVIYNGRGVELILKNCAILNNTTALGSAQAIGGAISSTGSTGDGSFVFINTTFYGNQVTGGGRGGAVYSGMPVTMLNCTFTNNHADGEGKGGGFYMHNNFPAKIVNCVFAQNTATGANALAADLHRNNGTFTIYNSIGGNVSTVAGSLDWTINGNRVYLDGIDVLFEKDGSGIPVLKDNGGNTKTVALESFLSIAATAGKTSVTDFGSYEVPTKDQRGFSRSTTTPSVGAYEFGGAASLKPVALINFEVLNANNQIVLRTNSAGTCFVYNETGALVHKEILNGTTILNKNLKPGFYMLNFIAQDKASSGVVKVIVK